MGRVFQARAQAIKKKPAADQTFAELVTAHSSSEAADPAITNDEVALFNWGTTDKAEVLRALREVVGVKTEDPDPYACKLDPTLGADGEFLLPKVWKPAGLALTKTHKVTIKKQLPAPAVSFKNLSKWFIPGDEMCDVEFHTEGIAERADKMDFEVMASNYSKATATNNGEFVTYVFAALPDVPVFQKTLPTAAGTPRADATVADWDGESKAADGILKPRGTTKRLINAANAPYTVNLRYYKKLPDPAKPPRIEIESFWPTWTGPTLDAESKKIKFEIKNCTVLKFGQVVVTKKDGSVVWRRALKHDEVTQGKHTIDNWPATGATAAEMPYRAEIQAHTDWDTDEGIGLAAMHTDVRIYAHPESGTKPDAFTEAASLTLAMAPFLPGTTAPGDDTAKGRKLKLAKAGYHPGPIDDDEANADYVMAVKELQRDSVKSGATTRLKADGTIDADTKTVITALAAGKRPMFGDPANRSDLTGSVDAKLRDPSKALIVWVSDRHVYTKVDAPKPVANINTNAELENYRDGMALAADGKVTRDAASIVRPRIPVESAISLLGKGADLTLVKGSPPMVTDNMRKAIGPIRVDWTFREPAPESNVDTAAYYDQHMRPQAYLDAVFTAQRGTHNGKDANNCKVTYGGIRSTAAYHQDPFATGTPDSLTPWAALVDGTVKSVCSVVHDDLGQDAARVFDTHVGKAGVYLKLSTIGGDGFIFRSQVRFDNLPSGASTPPNWATLKKRYAKLPHVVSCSVRTWRKCGLKGYIAWCAAGQRHWGGTYNVETKFAAYFKPAFIHYVHETGAAGTFARTTVFPNTDLAQYQNVVGDNTLNIGVKYSTKATITIKDDYIWPWCDEPHIGVKFTLPGNLAVNPWWSTISDQIYDETWRKWRYPLMYEILKRVETANTDRLRGHLVVEFKDSPQLWIEGYVCPTNVAHKHWMLETTATGGSSITGNEKCQFCPNPKPDLISSRRQRYRCTGGPQGNHEITVNENPAGNSKTGQVCGAACTGQLKRDVSSKVAGFFTTKKGTVNTVYECSACGHETKLVEQGSNAGSRTGQACTQTCAGTHAPVPGTLTNQQIYGPISGIGLPAVGAALGGSWIFTETKPEPTWAHEIGHHKHLEHAASGPGAKVDQHDSSANANVTNPPETVALKKNWDRCCIMSYTHDDGANDRLYFCGRCILKLRGWKVEGGALVVGGGTNGP